MKNRYWSLLNFPGEDILPGTNSYFDIVTPSSKNLPKLFSPNRPMKQIISNPDTNILKLFLDKNIFRVSLVYDCLHQQRIQGFLTKPLFLYARSLFVVLLSTLFKIVHFCDHDKHLLNLNSLYEKPHYHIVKIPNECFKLACKIQLFNQ